MIISLDTILLIGITTAGTCTVAFFSYRAGIVRGKTELLMEQANALTARLSAENAARKQLHAQTKP
jgi:hypothetical protein